MDRTALIVGVTGIVGSNLAEHLLQAGWEVHGLARQPQAAPPGSSRSRPTCSTRQSLRAARWPGVDPTHVFITTWLRQATEAENCAVNGAMVRNLLDAARTRPASLRHVALVTGLKHYLGPFEAYAKAKPETPFREEHAAAALPELLLRPGGRALRGGRAAGLHLERAPAAHDHRLRARQRHEHGRDPRRLRHDLPETGRPFVFPGSPAAVGGADRRDRRPAPRPAPGVGGDHRGRPQPGVQHRQRRHLPLALAVAAARGRLRDRGGARTRATPSPLEPQTGGRRAGLGRDRGGTASPSPTSAGSPRRGTPTWTSAARSRS